MIWKKLGLNFALSLLLMVITTAVIFSISNIGNDAVGFGLWVVLLMVVLVTPILFLVWMLPLHLLFNRLHLRNFKAYLLAGFVPWPVLFAILRPLGDEPFWYLVYHSVFGGIVGMAGAATFFYLAVHRENPKPERPG